MNIDSIQNGVVLDHIQAGKGMDVYKYLRLDQLDCQVAIIKNARSEHMGKKDIIKIDYPLDLDLDVLGYIDSNITVNIIRDGKRVEKKHLELPKGEFGIKLTEVGPYSYDGKAGEEKWEWTWMPVITKACDMCADRVAKGKIPMCVQHCQAWCMYHGEVEDLVKKMDGKTRWALLTAKA